MDAADPGAEMNGVEAPRPWRRVNRALFVALAVLGVVAGVFVVTDAPSDARKSDYPKFCATASQFNSIAGDSDSVTMNATTIDQILSELQQLPASKRPDGAAPSARKLDKQLAAFMAGAGYEGGSPTASALKKWETTARTLRTTIRNECGKAATSVFFGTSLPGAPTAPHPVAGWAIPGIRSLCITANGTFEGTPQPLADAMDTSIGASEAAGSYFDESQLKPRLMRAVEPGQPCDATLTTTYDSSALSSVYEVDGVSTTMYTGAEWTGALTLSAPGQPDLVFPFTGRKDPPSITTENPSRLPLEPADAFHHVNIALQRAAAVVQWFGILPAVPVGPQYNTTITLVCDKNVNAQAELLLARSSLDTKPLVRTSDSGGLSMPANIRLNCGPDSISGLTRNRIVVTTNPAAGWVRVLEFTGSFNGGCPGVSTLPAKFSCPVNGSPGGTLTVKMTP